MRHAKPIACVALLALCLAAAPASQPTTQVTDSPALRKRLAALIAENADLRAQLDALTAERTKLRSEVARLAAPTTKSSADELHQAAATLEIGFMGEEDVQRVLGKPERVMREGSGKAMYFRAGNLTVRCFIGQDWRLATVTERTD